jgi:TRAP-type uncharacterized transport system fused permease subunit
MAWVDIIKEEGIQFYSVADSVETLHESFFSFWIGVSPGMIFIFILFTVLIMASGILYSVFKSVKAGGI